MTWKEKRQIQREREERVSKGVEPRNCNSG